MQSILVELTHHNVVVEDFGGEVQVAMISAITGEGIQDLLEKVLLQVRPITLCLSLLNFHQLCCCYVLRQADVMMLTSPTESPATGVILEASVHKKHGMVSTALVQSGTLRVGDIVLAGSAWGKVKRMLSDSGSMLKFAGPSVPVQV